MATIDLTTTATVPANTSLTVTVYEDVGNDGAGANTDPNGKAYDNSASQSVSSGTNTYSLTGFDKGLGNAYWIRVQPDNTDETATATLDSATIDVGAKVGGSVAVSATATGHASAVEVVGGVGVTAVAGGDHLVAPTLSLTVTSSTQIDASWTDAGNESQYELERREQFRDGFGDWLTVATLSANVTSYSDTNVLPDTTYQYRVTASNVGGSHTSASKQATTNDDGVPTDAIPARGWHVVVEDPQGATYRPSIVGEPALNPTLNGLPTVEVPVERSDRWSADQWERQPMRVYHDGERQPIEEVQSTRQEPDRSILRGVGGVELRARESKDVIEQDAHLAAQDVIQTTTYTANVDAPQATTSTDVLMLDVDSQSEWENNLQSAPFPNDDPRHVQNGILKTHKTAIYGEAENGSYSGPATSTFFADRFAQGAAAELGQVQNNVGDSVTVSLTNGYDYPNANARVGVRLEYAGSTHPGFDLIVDGTTVISISADQDFTNLSMPAWFFDGQDVQALTAGSHTVEVVVTAEASDSSSLFVDCITLFDDRYTTLSDEDLTNGGKLSSPILHPTIASQTPDQTTVRQVVAGELDSTWNNVAGGSQEVAISNDSGGTWHTAANSSTVSATFAAGSTNIRARLTQSHFDDGGGPVVYNAGQEVDLFKLFADLEDTPLLVNRSWDDSKLQILNDIADYGNFIWEVQYDGGFSVEWTQAGQRTASVDPSLVDYSVGRDFSSIHRKAIIYGTSRPVTGITFTSNVGNWVDLPHNWLLETGEKVTTTDGATQFDRGVDYDLRPNAGQIKVLSSGSMQDATSYAIEYDRRIRGSYTSTAHDGTYETLVETLPALTTERNADQAALSIVKQASEPIETATVTIQKQPTGLSLVEAVDVAELPTSESMEVWSVEDSPQQVTLQLGSREPIEETLTRIQARLAATSRKT